MQNVTCVTSIYTSQCIFDAKMSKECKKGLVTVHGKVSRVSLALTCIYIYTADTACILERTSGSRV